MDVNQKYIIPYNRSESASHECTASSCACRNTAPWSRPRCTGQTGQTTGESFCSSYRRWVAPDTKIRSRGWERCYGWGFTVFYMKKKVLITVLYKSLLYLVVAVIVNLGVVPKVEAFEDSIHLVPPDGIGNQLVPAVGLELPNHLPPGD